MLTAMEQAGVQPSKTLTTRVGLYHHEIVPVPGRSRGIGHPPP
jgi:hypothetical protein